MVILSAVSCASKTYDVPGTPLVVSAPRGFEQFEVYETPPYPELYFQPVRTPGDETNRYPYMTIEQARAIDSRGLMNLDEYVEQQLMRGPIFRELMKPQETSVGNTRAIELAFEAPVEEIMSTGHNRDEMRVFYTIAFQRDGFVYECQMEATSDNYKTYIPVFQDFCASVNFKN